MKVILKEDVRGVGHKYDVKEVSDGYARNFLFQRGLAEAATPEAIKKLATIKATKESEEKELKGHLERLARDMSDKSVEFELKVGEDGSVYGSVTKEMILKAIRDHFSKHDRVDILLEHPIKQIGEHMVPVDLKKGIETKIKVIVRPQK
jgi:large subunit ribosomal protein L9